MTMSPIVRFGSTPPATPEKIILSMVIMIERHVLLSYMKYYNETRTRLSLNKDAPIPRAVQAAGRILCLPILGGLHHQYGRI
jgi:hypothetical protein